MITIKLSNNPEYHGSEATQEDADTWVMQMTALLKERYNEYDLQFLHANYEEQYVLNDYLGVEDFIEAHWLDCLGSSTEDDKYIYYPRLTQEQLASMSLSEILGVDPNTDGSCDELFGPLDPIKEARWQACEAAQRKRQAECTKNALRDPFTTANWPKDLYDVKRERALKEDILNEHIHDIEEIDGVFVGHCGKHIVMTKRVVNFYNWNSGWQDCDEEKIANTRKEIVIKYFSRNKVPFFCTAFHVFNPEEIDYLTS